MGYRHLSSSPARTPGATCSPPSSCSAPTSTPPKARSTTRRSSEHCPRSWTHTSATSHRSARVTASCSIAGRRPRTRATACASSCGASADGPTPDQASGGQTRGSSSRAGRTDTASPASAERPASTRCLRALVQRSGDGLGGRAWPPDGTSRPRTARRGVSIFYRRGGRAVGGPRAPAPRLDLGRST